MFITHKIEELIYLGLWYIKKRIWFSANETGTTVRKIQKHCHAPRGQPGGPAIIVLEHPGGDPRENEYRPCFDV